MAYRKSAFHRAATRIFVCTALLSSLCVQWLGAQEVDLPSVSPPLAWSTDSVGPQRFVSVHGRKAAMFGYSESGLEVWAYPIQILDRYQISFRREGSTTAIDGTAILRRIVYRPESITRVYAGPDFVVLEKLFVPLDEPGAIITYEIRSARPIDIEVRFQPVLDLMWPAGVGGQEVAWHEADSSYLLSEESHRLLASIGSPDIIAHDETPNDTQHVGRFTGLAFTIRAGGTDNKPATVIIAGGGPTANSVVMLKRLLEQKSLLEQGALDHYSTLLAHNLQIETPDESVNRALAWSEIAVDQAWVCNSDLGCGVVAGYGPSRKARRPQYDWFFAGDGMVAVQALLSSGEYGRARQELEFIFKYQDQQSGMVWHELSQSAGWLNWDKYPYLFAHVDLTFDFLNTLGTYYAATGDSQFLTIHWPAIESAYSYCQSLLDPTTGLPTISAGKHGNREQDSLSDELALSASWVDAAQSFAVLASATGHEQAARIAKQAGLAAGIAISKRYWNNDQKSWITGYSRSGIPLADRELGPAKLIDRPSFTEDQRDSVISRLSSSNFQTDWGTRGKSSASRSYDPNAYSSGSVWAIGTAGAAEALWRAHRPLTAFPVWNSLVSWSSLDSMGHVPEALAGNDYREEEESIPEQTWSSASFFTATVTGLLGLTIDGARKQLTFAPHLPATWNTLALKNIRVGASIVKLTITRSLSELRLQMQNDGPDVRMVFDPELPYGADLPSARFGDQSIVATLEPHPQDTHARVDFTLAHGNSLLAMTYRGGLSIIPELPQLAVGEPSHAIKFTGINLHERTCSVDFEYVPSVAATFDVRTQWKLVDAKAASFSAVTPDSYRISVHTAPDPQNPDDKTGSTDKKVYRHGQVVLTFGRN